MSTLQEIKERHKRTNGLLGKTTDVFLVHKDRGELLKMMDELKEQANGLQVRLDWIKRKAREYPYRGLAFSVINMEDDWSDKEQKP